MTVHDLDWSNRTYFGGVGEARDYLPMRAGTYQRGKPNDDNYLYAKVDSPTFGDVTGDRRDEALVRLVINTGGTGWFDVVNVFAMDGNSPYVLGTIGGGDRGDGGIVQASVVDGNVAIVRNQSLDGDGACCPSTVLHEVWHWNGKQFVEDTTKRTSQAMPKEQ